MEPSKTWLSTKAAKRVLCLDSRDAQRRVVRQLGLVSPPVQQLSSGHARPSEVKAKYKAAVSASGPERGVSLLQVLVAFLCFSERRVAPCGEAVAPQTSRSAVRPAYPIALPLLSPSAATRSQIPVTPQLCQSSCLRSHRVNQPRELILQKNKITSQKKKTRKKKKTHPVRRGLNKNCKNPWGKLDF